MSDEELSDRLRDLDHRLTRLGPTIVAFSGGADSAFLVAAAARALGPDQVLAVTSTSASLASGEWAAARQFATSLGVEHVAVVTDEMTRTSYRANGPDRCYHCKSALGDLLLDLARQRGVPSIAYGTNADDLAEFHRPGLRAARERRVATPLADAGLTKQDVRTASRAWGLPTWDKPQAACLASRVAYGVEVDPERLARVDRAEAAVRSELARWGIPAVNLRVRDLGDRARIEVDREHVAAVRERSSAVAVVVAAGFRTAEVDDRGFRSGAMNEVLGSGDLARSSWDLPLVD